MKKYLIIAAMLLTLMFTITACGSSETGTPGQTIASPAPTAAASANTQKALLADTYPIKDIVTVGRYKGIEITPLELTVTDEEVDLECLLSMKTYAEATDRTVVENYDIANIDFEGKKDGVAFEGGTSEGYDLFIGSGNFIPGFEEGLIGVAVGDTVDIPLTFPENYGNASLAGQDVVFTVTVNSLKALPELNDAFIAEKTEFDTVAAYKDDIRATLQSSFDATVESQFESDLMAAIIDGSTFHMDLSPEITAYAVNMQEMYASYASMYGVSLDVYIGAMFGMSLDAFMAELPKSAEQLIKRYYVMLAVADAENMTVSNEEYEEFADQMMLDYGYETREEMEADYPKKTLENSLLYDRAFAFVMENAVRK